jgi:hypothetical protein
VGLRALLPVSDNSGTGGEEGWMWEIADSEVKSTDIPPADADWDEISKFA